MQRPKPICLKRGTDEAHICLSNLDAAAAVLTAVGGDSVDILQMCTESDGNCPFSYVTLWTL